MLLGVLGAPGGCTQFSAEVPEQEYVTKRFGPALITAVVIILAIAGCMPLAVADHLGAGHHRGPRPNFVFVLTDDLAENLVRYMPHVQALERAGSTMSRYYVVDSLCCPSRSAIFTGEYPHDDGVFTNTGSDGATVPSTRTGMCRRPSRAYCRSPATGPP